MTPDRWAAMQTAANRQDAHDWVTLVGWAAVVTLGLLLTVVAVLGAVRIGMWARWQWCRWQEERTEADR